LSTTSTSAKGKKAKEEAPAEETQIAVAVSQEEDEFRYEEAPDYVHEDHDDDPFWSESGGPKLPPWRHKATKGFFLLRPEEKVQVREFEATIVFTDIPRTFFAPKQASPWHAKLKKFGLPANVPLCSRQGIAAAPQFHSSLQPVHHQLLHHRGAGNCSACNWKNWLKVEGGDENLPPLCDPSRIFGVIMHSQPETTREIVKGDGKKEVVKYGPVEEHHALIQVSGLRAIESVDGDLLSVFKKGKYPFHSIRVRFYQESFENDSGQTFYKVRLKAVKWNDGSRLGEYQDMKDMFEVRATQQRLLSSIPAAAGALQSSTALVHAPATSQEPIDLAVDDEDTDEIPF
jgi:hypothetical protein